MYRLRTLKGINRLINNYYYYTHPRVARASATRKRTIKTTRAIARWIKRDVDRTWCRLSVRVCFNSKKKRRKKPEQRRRFGIAKLSEYSRVSPVFAGSDIARCSNHALVAWKAIPLRVRTAECVFRHSDRVLHCVRRMWKIGPWNPRHSRSSK